MPEIRIEQIYADGKWTVVEHIMEEPDPEATPQTVEDLLPVIAALEKEVNALQAKLGIAQTPDDILGKIKALVWGV